MANPFKKRAAEYLRDDAAFLSVIVPTPLYTFFEKHAKEGKLYDRLSMIIGTPGSGKTIISHLLQYQTVQTLLENQSSTNFKPLIDALNRCGIIEKSENTSSSKFVGCRIPMESEYRDLWELPYKENIRMGLLKSFLQARAMLSWLKSINNNPSVALSSVKIQFREGASVAENSLGGIDGKSLFEKARHIEYSIYEVGAALMPPSEDKLSSNIASGSYRPFDAIEYFVIGKKNNPVLLRPMVMLDDAHILHRDQLLNLVSWLAKREMKIARWIFMRLDTITPKSIFSGELNTEHESPIKQSREITYIWLRDLKNRKEARSEFQKLAQTMANKYLRLMGVFADQGPIDFSDILNKEVAPITGSKMKKLEDKVEKLASKINIHKQTYQKFKKGIESYFLGARTIDNSEDVKLAMLYIMLNRYGKRLRQGSLFDQSDNQQILPNFKPKLSSSLADGAKIFLMHEYGRPYYYGVDTVCNGSSENAEQFLQLSSRLVDASKTRIIRSQSASLSPDYQHKLLKKRAEEIVEEWDFPKSREVKTLCEFMAKECLAKSLEPNAPLNGGANAFGVPQDEFEEILSEPQYSELREILRFGVAYNAIIIKPKHSTKHKLWTLIELSGPVIISYGLTLSRGGFLERTVSDLLRGLKEEKI